MIGMKGKSTGRSGQNPPYSQDIHRPVTSLVFLLPLVVVYELGTLLMAGNLPEALHSRVIAFQLLHRFLALFGATIFYLPGLLVPAILVAWHVATGDTWRVHKRTLGLMAVESLLLAIPLVVFYNVGSSYVNLWSPLAAPAAEGWHGKLLLSIGAGIYEELLFRLILISLLGMIMIDLARLPEPPSVFFMVLISATAFSLYHYLGPETFSWPTFMFRAVAGGYLAGIFILRGFGITVGCHVVYDILAMILNALAGSPE